MTAHSASSFAPSLGVACPECYADRGEQCWTFGDVTRAPRQLKRVHPARRRAADEKRTQEVQAAQVKP